MHPGGYGQLSEETLNNIRYMFLKASFLALQTFIIHPARKLRQRKGELKEIINHSDV